jgi:hypothetical protein
MFPAASVAIKIEMSEWTRRQGTASWSFRWAAKGDADEEVQN